MKKIVLYLLLITTTTCLFTACRKDKPDKIIGKWERFDDSAEGTIVTVNKVGELSDEYQAILVHLEGTMLELGFKESEVKWKSITKKGKAYYTAQDLLKAVNDQDEIAFHRYDSVHIEMVSDDILHIKGFAEAEEILGTEQKWRRMDE